MNRKSLAAILVSAVTAALVTALPAAAHEPGCKRHVEEGTASWYGGSLNGAPTASGAEFDMNGLTAAHRRLPFGTRIKVTNLDNGKAAVFTVNDRGPFVRGRILDVSYKGAQVLGFKNDGIAPVRVETATSC